MQAKTLCVMASLSLVVLAGCSKKDDPKLTVPTASASAPITAATSAAPTATASAAPSASAASSLPVPWEKALKEGVAYDKTWTPAYSIYRKAGGIGLSITEAYSYCEGQGKALCSEVQYRRACAEEPELGKIETWTGSGDAAADQLTVVGGGDCMNKQFVAATDKKPGRATLCCDRAIGVRTEYKSMDFMVATQKHVGAYENALKGRDPLSLQDLYHDKVIFENKVYDRTKLLEMHKEYWKKVPQQWTQFDWCRVTMQTGKDFEGNDDKQFQTDCAALFRIGPDVHFAMQRIIKGKSSKGAAAIIYIGDVSSSSAPSGIDMKTAIEKGFIGADPSAAASGSSSASAASSAPGAPKEKKVRVGVLMVVD
ncbi:MAG: hypothetical protein HY898_17115 [Deltaproteobacteria bacterium]|nr:hypothetical protein [Deltaproteobacteria bacterium]